MDSRILVIIAALNEAKALRVFLPELREALLGRAEIVVVDDGSDDNTAQIVRNCQVRLLVNDRNRGKREAVHRAMREIAVVENFDAVITCDGDGQHPVAAVLQIMEALERHDVVFSTRFGFDSPDAVGSVPLDRRLLNRMVRAAIDDVIDWRLSDPLCGLRGFSLEVAERLLAQEFVTDGYGHEIETLLRLWHDDPGRSFAQIAIPPVYAGAGKIGEIYGIDMLDHRTQRAQMHLAHIVRVIHALHIGSR